MTRVNRIELGMRGSAENRETAAPVRDIPEESLMLSGDENIVNVDFVVFWRISDAPKFLSNIDDPEMTVKDVAESAMRRSSARAISNLSSPRRARRPRPRCRRSCRRRSTLMALASR